MKRHLRFFATLLLLVIITTLAWVNFKLYDAPEIRIVEKDTINYDVLCQLRYLRDAIANNAADEMQNIYPEGYVFFNSLYGLSWIDFATSLDRHSILYAEAHVEIQRAYNNVSSDHARSSFDESLPLPYGAFYSGWSTYVLGKKLESELPENRNTSEIATFINACDKISEVLNEQTFPSTYYGSAWPADVVMCAATLAIHDRLFEARYRPTLRSWVDRVKKLSDPSGLIPHSAHAITGKPLQAARGSSQGLMLCFLREVDPEFANAQFQIYKEKFPESIFGLPGVREYPLGTDGEGDIDSGPVIFEIGSAATITGFRAMIHHGDVDRARAIRNTIEALALPRKKDGKKKYLAGKMPMADVFIAWSNTAFKADISQAHHTNWQRTFQWLTFAIVLPSLALILFMWRERIKFNWRIRISKKLFSKKKK